MTTRTEYDERAQRHAPKTAEQIQAAARALARDGHTDHTIAQILRLDVQAVRQLIGAPSTTSCAE
jgi:hypothetical protein